MLEKVAKLKKFGIFRDFLWDSHTPNFARFNLIYGWNKSGKTTFSRAFAACEKRTTVFEQYPKEGEFEIKTINGSMISHANCQEGMEQIRVFNKDFIQDNVSFDPKNPSNPIVYVSEGDIESNRKLEELRGQIIPLSQKYEIARSDLNKNEKAEDDFRKSTARIIKDVIGNLKINDKYRDYDKSRLKTAIENIGIENCQRLSEEEFEKKKRFIGDAPLDSQAVFLKYGFSFLCDGKNLQKFPDIYNELSVLLGYKIMAKTIDRFKNDPELNKWAQHGYELYKTKEEKKKCLFCESEIPAGFLESLAQHFSDDYEKLQNKVSVFINGLANLKKEKISEKNLKLYSDLQNRYASEVPKLNSIVDEINNWIDKAIETLQKKQSNPLADIIVPELPKEFNDLYDGVIVNLNSIISDHNAKIGNHETEVDKAKEELERHLIAVAITEQDYSQLMTEYDASVKAANEAKKAVDENNAQISTLEKKTSDIGKAVVRINTHLEEFFGRKELVLELDDSKKGYVVKRDGDVAYNLSEGEKNAIALAYFIVKTKEKGFKAKEGIIVIDDPISSFDSNFIYHCFSLIKNYFKEAKQLIVSTHSFEFFNLVKNWFEHKNQNVESANKKITNQADKKQIPCEFFMIENVIKNEKRCASIVRLEETLRKFKSEYHFLFFRLNQFITEGSPDYADFYTIGNLARRFLEIYINFKIPTTGDLKSKVDQLDTQTVSETEKDKVYKLIQEFSHSLDPASAIEHKDKSEIQNAIKVLMRMVEESDKKHFESLKSNLQ